ncbi:DNA adenine methylase [Rathayibacter agropyri]
MDFLLPNIPQEFGNYHEPFLGGGALALHLIPRQPGMTSYLSDFNPHLINAWRAVKNDVEGVLEQLREHQERNDRDWYRSVQHWDRNGSLEHRTETEQGARFIYLMNNAFGAMYVENAEGQMTTSFNKSRDWLVDEKNLRAVSSVLNENNVHIAHQSYEDILPNVRVGDFVYLDPPYATDSDDGRATFEYGNGSFGVAWQKRVKHIMRKLTAKGAMVLVSNSDTATTRSLFEGWNQLSKMHFHSIGGAHDATEVIFANHNLMRTLAASLPARAEVNS